MTAEKKPKKPQSNGVNETIFIPSFTPLSFSALPAMKRFAVGFLFLVIYAIFSPYYPDSYFLTDEFEVRITSEIKSRDKSLHSPHYSKITPLLFTGTALLVSLCIYAALG